MLDRDEEGCPERCDRGVLKSRAEDPGHPCPVCDDGRVQLDHYFMSLQAQLATRTNYQKGRSS